MNRSAYYFQTPVGNCSYAGLGQRISTQQEYGLTAINDWATSWFASGTMALAAAISIAVRRKQVAAPKVLVPGYSCPDLVSAIRYNGAQPVYVDMIANESRMDLRLAADALNIHNDIVAIVGVDLFGLHEDWDGLRDLADANGIFAIQDCAQSFQAKEKFLDDLRGDAVVHSFGRGKPVCCLAGGAMLLPSRDGDFEGHDAARFVNSTGVESPMLLRLRNSLYNFLIKPPVYAQFAKMMGARLGETRYVPLGALKSIPKKVAYVVNASVSAYWNEHSDSSERVFAALRSSVTGSSIRYLGNLDRLSSTRRLSRLPLLVDDSTLRLKLIGELRSAGISASTMYSKTLPEIVADHDKVDDFERLAAAQSFADSLITIPVHGRLREVDIEMMSNTIRSIIS